jgi:hypothetical protein
MSLPTTHDRLRRQGIVLLIALAFFWGNNWPIMKNVLSEASSLVPSPIIAAVGTVSLRRNCSEPSP